MRNIIALCALVIFFVPSAMQAEIGCIDNSWHLQKAYDAKEYHLVACNCPCSRHEQSDDRGRCSKCKHFRDPRPFIIIQPSKDTVYSSQIERPSNNKRKKQLTWRAH